jgi:hypothetical protein
VDPVPDPLLLRKSGRDGDRTRTSGLAARTSDHQTTEAVLLLMTEKWNVWSWSSAVWCSQQWSSLSSSAGNQLPDQLRAQIIECHNVSLTWTSSCSGLWHRVVAWLAGINVDTRPLCSSDTRTHLPATLARPRTLQHQSSPTRKPQITRYITLHERISTWSTIVELRWHTLGRRGMNLRRQFPSDT